MEAKLAVTGPDHLPLALVVGPTGAGKSFAALQMACVKFVDIIDAGNSGCIGNQLFCNLKALCDAGANLELLRVEHAASVSSSVLRSQWAQYLLWILAHTLAALRSVCETPRDWLFFQRYHGTVVCEAFERTLRCAGSARLSYAQLCGMVPTTAPYAFILDEAAAVMDQVAGAFANPRQMMAPDTPVVSTVGDCPEEVECHGSAPHVPRMLRPARQFGQHRTTSRSGLVGCIMSATWTYRVPVVLMGTAFSFQRADAILADWDYHNGGGWSPYVPTSSFPHASEDFCRKYIEFYYKLLHRKDLTEDIGSVCYELQGG